MSMISDKYIIAALERGIQVVDIARAMGVTESAIVQRIQDGKLDQLAKENSRFAKIDESLNKLEEQILTKLTKALDITFLNPVQLSAIYKNINSAKRRSLAEGQTIINQNNMQLVSLELPERHMPKVVKNSNNEIIEVDGRALQTIPSGQLSEKVNPHGIVNSKPVKKLKDIL